MSAHRAWRLAPLLPAIAAGVVSLPHPPRASQPPDPPRVLDRVVAVAPDSLSGLRLTGWVMVRIRIDAAGRVAEASAIDRSASDFFFGPHAPVFERVAVAAARGHRFGPGAGQDSPAGVFAMRMPFHGRPDTAARATGTLVGDVFDLDRRWRLSGVGICVQDARVATLSEVSGDYRLGGLPPGRHEIVVSANGYAPMRQRIVVRPGAIDTLALRLRPCPGCARARCFDIPRRASP